MPPTGAATKVKDPEYSNWLKVSLALYYLTVGFHSFIQGEVDALHQFLLQKLYRGSGVTKPQCSSCKSKDVKQNRNTYDWKFKSSCPSHLCDTWLAELLTLHTNPKSNKIYWDNCDVTAWPFVPWECAKLYMPRGQLPANTGPVKCDSQALLTLMANCKYFHGKLSPAGLRLTHTVSKIRNSVMHSEDMRLSDGDSKSFIQDIISLLEDSTHLKSLEECKLAVNEINKIDTDSIAVFFNEELERLALMTAVNAVRQDMGKQEERTLDSVESLKEEYIQLKEETRTKIDTVENRVGIVENRQGTVVNDLETMENRVDCVENRVVTVENRHNTVENDLETIDNRVHSVENRVVTVENRQDTVVNDLETMVNRVDCVENRVVTVENRQDTVENRVVTVENRQSTMEKIQDTVLIRLDTIERVVESVMEKTQQQQVEFSQAISASVAAFAVKVKAVEEKLTSLQEGRHRTGDNIACIEEPATVSSIKQEDINNLRGELIKVYKHLRCVKVSPIYEMTRCPEMDNVYVDLVIETNQDSKIKVTSYKQIFLDERGSKLKRVYLRGKGGLGKTTFCRRVLHAWCNAHEGKAVAQDGPFQDEAMLKMFDILLYMNLREVSLDKYLIEVICDKLHFSLPITSFLETLLRLNGDKILFILDGLDEIVNDGVIEDVVFHREYPDCFFLVSSRPWKISQIELIAKTEIELLLDLRGFSKRNAVRFAENIFRNCYNDGNVIQQFEQDIEHNNLAKQLIHVPILLVLLTHCWYEKRSLPTKLHELYISFLNMMADRLTEKYKEDPNHSQMNVILGDTHSAFPKKLSETSLVVKFGEQFLLSLCGAAHHFLLSNEKENSLVFEETELLNALGDRGEEILDVSLKLGLLSVTDSVSYLNRKLSVSFLHKTIQEFFTAACFILSPDKLVDFISSIRELNDVQQNENIILFLVGLMPEHGNSVLEKVNELYRKSCEQLRSNEELEMDKFSSGEELEINSEEKLYNDFFWQMNRTQLFDTNSIYLRCKEEVIGKNVQLNVSCLCLEDQSLDVKWMNPAVLQILDLMKIRFPDDRADLRGLTGLTHLALRYLNCELYLPESSCLSVLNLENVRLLSSDSNVMTHCTKLKRLWIWMTDLHNCLLDLSKMTELTHLYMSQVTMSSSCCDILGSSLTHCTKLGSLCIHRTELQKCRLDLSNMTELTVLVMSRVTLSRKGCDVLGSTLTHCTKLERLSIHMVNLHNCLLKISNMMGLKNLDMSEVTLSSNCDKFDTKLIDCTKLDRLRIRRTNLHNFLLDLSNMTELTHLYMSEVTLSSGCCDALGRTLTYCTKLKKLTIDKTNLHDCLLDFSNVTQLTELKMLSVRLSSDCCDVLGRSLTYCTKIELLSISNMDLHNCLLDFSNMTELTVLNVFGIRLSHSSCHIFCRTLSHCTKLKLRNMNISSKDILNCGTPIDLYRNKT